MNVEGPMSNDSGQFGACRAVAQRAKAGRSRWAPNAQSSFGHWPFIGHCVIGHWSYPPVNLLRAFLLILCLPMLPGGWAQAHTANESYLIFRLEGTNLTGQLDVARRDLQQGILVSGTEVATLSL